MKHTIIVKVDVWGFEYECQVTVVEDHYVSATCKGDKIAKGSPTHHCICKSLGLKIENLTKEEHQKAEKRRTEVTNEGI